MNQKEVSKGKLISVVIGCFMLMVSSSVVSNSQGYFLTPVREFLGCTAAQFSLYYSFVQICTVITSLCIGIIMAKVPRRIMLGVGAIGTAPALSSCRRPRRCGGYMQAPSVLVSSKL